MNNSRVKFLLLLIVIFFLITRFYKINEIPPSVYWDEASIGYNAYSITKDGKDEWGEFLPIHFRAFGEFKLPVYIYATAISVKLFGLNEFSVRLPAVLFSLGVLFLTFLLSEKISNSNKVGLFSSFLICISPWFFIFSRTGYEATAGLMFYLLGIYLFLLYKKSPLFFIFSALSFIISIYSYNSFRIITPLTIIILSLYEVRNLKIYKKDLIIYFFSLSLFIISWIPIYRLYVYDAGASRLQTVGALNAESFLRNYISHFSLNFLLLGDKNLRSQQSGFGQVYFPELVLLALGLLYIISRAFLRLSADVGSKSRYRFLPVILALIGPVPAAITKESPHALRALSMVPFICMISAMGLFQIKKYLPLKYFVELGGVVVLLLFFLHYFINFLNVYPQQSAEAWQYEYKEEFSGLDLESDKREKIYISDEDGQPYIFALFYLKYDPEKFRDEVVRNSVDKWGSSTVKSFGKFEFGKNR